MIDWLGRLVRRFFPSDEEMHVTPTAPAPLMPRGMHGWQPVSRAEPSDLRSRAWARDQVEHEQQAAAQRRLSGARPQPVAAYRSRCDEMEHSDPYLESLTTVLLAQAAADPNEPPV